MQVSLQCCILQEGLHYVAGGLIRIAALVRQWLQNAEGRLGPPGAAGGRHGLKPTAKQPKSAEAD